MRVVVWAALALSAGAYISPPVRVLRTGSKSAAASSQNALPTAHLGLLRRTATQSRSARLSPILNTRMAAASKGPQTLFDKIWRDHVVDEQPDGTTLLYIDRHLVHEVTSPQAFEGLRTAGRKARRPENTLATVDHNVPTTDRSMFESVETFIKEVESQTQVLRRSPSEYDVLCFLQCLLCLNSFIRWLIMIGQVLALEENVREFGLTYFGMDDKRQGIVHIIGPENGFTLPGTTVVCGDRLKIIRDFHSAQPR
jgi:hypothetical protein